MPHSIDSTPIISWGNALLVDATLLVIFAIQHSVMARKGFKNWWTQFVPKPIERSTYVLFSSLCLIALFYFWQPIGGSIWNVTNPTGVAIQFEESDLVDIHGQAYTDYRRRVPMLLPFTQRR